MIKQVLLDWDGPLVNSADLAFECINEVLAHFGAEPLEKDNWQSIYEADFLKLYRERGINASLETILQIFDSKRSTKPRPNLTEGAKDTLRWLQDHGKFTAIVSMNSQSFIEEVLKENKATVNAVFSCADMRQKVLTIKNLIEALGNRPGEVIMVDDTDYFIAEAKKLGCITMAYTRGFCSKERLRKAKPDYLISSLYGLQRYINILDRR